jgi:hypothetical protein
LHGQLPTSIGTMRALQHWLWLRLQTSLALAVAIRMDRPPTTLALAAPSTA